MNLSSTFDPIIKRKFTFSKDERLLKRTEFKLLDFSGRKFYTKFFIFIVKLDKEGTSRIGITVSKKVGKANIRNKIKRIIREYYRLNKNLLRYICDIHIIVKKNVVGLTTREVWKNLDLFFHKIAFMGNDEKYTSICY